MIDPVETLLAPSSHNDLSLLNEPTLRAFVQRFVGEILKSIERVNTGFMTKDAGVELVRGSCGYYAAILASKVSLDGFEADLQWHPAGLAMFLRDSMKEHINVLETDEMVIAESLSLISHAVLTVLELPKGAHEHGIDQVIEYAVKLLGGENT